MALKLTLQGLFVYVAIAAYVVAFVAALAKRPGLARAARLAALGAVVVAFVYRWFHVRHIPFQNLFEVFLTMGMVVVPLSWYCRRRLGVAGTAADMIIGALVLFPVGFVFHAEPQKLPPALQCWLFAPHVGVYLLAYVIMAKAAVQAALQLNGHDPTVADPTLCKPELGTYRMVGLGFPFLTLGLILGSWWGKLAWGDYWGWDPKELWSLASWLAYVGYLHFRYLYRDRYAKVNSALALLGMALVLITLLWANLSRLFSGLHSYAS